MGAVVPLKTAWALAAVWYAGRMEANWRRRTAAEAQELFASLGLVDPFWKLL
jgi:hypothetical protein